jgi:hypothetical protein
VAGTSVKRLLCCGFRRTSKAMEQVYQCWWRLCREINVLFQVRIQYVLHFIFTCDLLADSRIAALRTTKTPLICKHWPV